MLLNVMAPGEGEDERSKQAPDQPLDDLEEDAAVPDNRGAAADGRDDVPNSKKKPDDRPTEKDNA